MQFSMQDLSLKYRNLPSVSQCIRQTPGSRSITAISLFNPKTK